MASGYYRTIDGVKADAALYERAPEELTLRSVVALINEIVDGDEYTAVEYSTLELLAKRPGTPAGRAWLRGFLKSYNPKDWQKPAAKAKKKAAKKTSKKKATKTASKKKPAKKAANKKKTAKKKTAKKGAAKSASKGVKKKAGKKTAKKAGKKASKKSGKKRSRQTKIPGT